MESRPPVTEAAYQAWYASGTQPTDNAGLQFEKFALDWHGDEDAKRNSLANTLEAAAKTDAKLVAEQLARWQAVAAQCHAQPFEMKTDWRLISGLGRKGSLEVGFTFHRYGFAYLPGSSVKGLARAWGLLEVAQALDFKDAKQLTQLDAILSEGDAPKFADAWQQAYAAAGPPASELAERFRAIFGSTANAGGAIFLEALPSKPPKLELDIMNPHYPKYYNGNELPTDSQNPNPVCFLAVAPGQAFQFAVGWRGAMQADLHEQATQWLKNGLQQLGVGAKTNAGYGYFVDQRNENMSEPPTKSTGQLTSVTKPNQSFKDQIGAVVNDGKGGKKIKLDRYEKPRTFREKWSDFEIKDSPSGGSTVVVDFEEYDGNKIKFTKIRKG